uniref:DUF2442 domain-containing protein n=1 Tax=Candidatus Kentrum eta TaxID=2126337 RepID=A0A450UYX2_9GAMM|nr:MAG: Protein of unknown function (DUF2442) [Candidatus Kentron sp. H]VFJ98554.1 MAG: Protein of unknown function (DUF2442) [Candidatus Kentron sp. H]VFK03298.1 MAG: Protein of unknown function (DUF2442) [Candidatus Kentron sp. H]
MTECISIAEARYIEGFRVSLRFDTGEGRGGPAGFCPSVSNYSVCNFFRKSAGYEKSCTRGEIAELLRDPIRFSQFHLDSWPTLAWDCGFDIAPESLYFRVTGKEAF